jgi:PAS domain S-box-containing protein
MKKRPDKASSPARVVRYGFAVLTILAVLLLVRIPVVGEGLGGLIFMAFFVSAWFGGLGPGLLSILLFQGIAIGTLVYARTIITTKTSYDLITILLVGVALCLLVEALHVARRREQAGRQWLSAVLSSIGDAVIATDNHGRVLFMNPVSESLCGWDAADAAGRPLDEVLRIINERTREPVESPAMRVLAEGVSVGLANHTLLVARDGTERPVDDSGAPIRGPEGRVDGVVLVCRDVTERRRVEARVAEEARRKDEFLAILAHELRNPLAAISNAAQLQAHPGAEEFHQWSHEVIERQVRRLTRLVDDLLDVSRIGRGKIQLRPQRIDLAEVLRSAAEAVRPLIDQRGHDLHLTADPERIELEADPFRLEQVLVNLLINAAKYTEPGGRIELAAVGEVTHAVVRVTDTGIGIEPELLPRVFDLFTQGNLALSRSEGGLGIGLTMVQKLIEMHGGSVEASSDGHGRGSVFTVRLPAQTGPAADQPAADRPEPARTVPLGQMS